MISETFLVRAERGATMGPSATKEEGRRTEHVHKEQFGHVAMTKMGLLFTDGGPDHGRFFGNNAPFFRGRFACPDLADQIS
jgi:hypothetical protein